MQKLPVSSNTMPVLFKRVSIHLIVVSGPFGKSVGLRAEGLAFDPRLGYENRTFDKEKGK